MNLFDVTSRLIKALNENYDVIDMGAVLSVISILESSTQITREQLEATRLAKYINLLRRRTKDESLARRAKSLLKIWREMVHQTDQQKQPQNISKQQQQQQSLQNNENSTSMSSHAAAPSNNEISQELNFSNVLKGTLQTTQQQYKQKQHNLYQQQQQHHHQKQKQPQRNISPIVIDIHDSNSSTTATMNATATTNDATNLNFNDIKNQAQAHAHNSLPAWSATAPMTNIIKNKQKKHKKEKKFKDRLQQQQQQQLLFNTNSSSSIIGGDERASQFNKNQSNISEILSLSNSSMNSNFPNERVSSSLVGSELSFAGKFKPKETTTTTIVQKNPEGGGEYFQHVNENSSSNSHLSQHSDYQKQQQKCPLVTDISSTSMLPHQDDNSSSQLVPIPLNVGPITASELLKQKKLQQQQHSPKKRGRKKGSKGVDSFISLDRTTLTSQMLMSSLNNGLKKVKTTKELYAEMQNRKLNATVNATTANSPTTIQSTPTILLSPSTPQTTKSTTSRQSTSSGSGMERIGFGNIWIRVNRI